MLVLEVGGRDRHAQALMTAVKFVFLFLECIYIEVKL